MRTNHPLTLGVLAPFSLALLGSLGCAQPPSRADHPGVIVDGEDLTPEELVIETTTTPKPDPDETIVGASSATTQATGIGFYALSRKKHRIRCFNAAGNKVLATYTNSITKDKASSPAKMKIVYQVGSKKVTVNANIVRSPGSSSESVSTFWTGTANGKKFSFDLMDDDGNAINGSPYQLSGNMAKVTDHVVQDLQGHFGSESFLCDVAVVVVANPEIAVAAPEVWLGVAIAGLLFC